MATTAKFIACVAMAVGVSRCLAKPLPSNRVLFQTLDIGDPYTDYAVYMVGLPKGVTVEHVVKAAYANNYSRYMVRTKQVERQVEREHEESNEVMEERMYTLTSGDVADDVIDDDSAQIKTRPETSLAFAQDETVSPNQRHLFGYSQKSCPADGGSSCATNCRCSSGSTKRTVRSRSGTCYTCRRSSRRPPPPPPSSSRCPDDSGRSCGTRCSCSSHQKKITHRQRSGTCYTCKRSAVGTGCALGETYEAAKGIMDCGAMVVSGGAAAGSTASCVLTACSKVGYAPAEKACDTWSTASNLARCGYGSLGACADLLKNAICASS